MFLLKQKLLLSLIIVFTAAGFSPGRAQQNAAPQSVPDLIKTLEGEMQQQHVAGMMLSIVTRDSVLYSGGVGYADASKRTPVSSRHLFRQASVTKLFLALGVLKLVQDGKLTLQSHLSAVAPEIPFRNQWEQTSPVTIEELLEHSTGFADKSPFEEYNFTGRRFDGLKGVKVFEKFMTSRWKPGERHAYSGVDYAILAYLIEKISRQPLDHFLRKNVFDPLQMPHANVNLAGKAPGIYAQGYVWQAGAYQPVPHQPQYNAGYGSLNASADDLTHALQAYLRGLATRSGQFLSVELLHESETPHSYLSAKAGLHNTYGYGNEGYELEGRIFRGHRGAIGGFLSAFLYDREAGIAYAFSINTHNEAFYRRADALIRAFVTRHRTFPAKSPACLAQAPALPTQRSASAKYLSAPKNAKPHPLNIPDFEQYAGYYRLANPGQRYTGFVEQWQNTLRLDTAAGRLNARLLLGGTLQFEQADDQALRFKAPHARFAHVALLMDTEGKPVFTDHTLHFIQISAFNAWFSAVMLPLSIILLVSAIAFGLVSIVLYIRKRWSVQLLLLRLSPALAGICMLLIIHVATQLMDLMKASLPTGHAQALWTIGKYGLALFTFATMLLLATSWRQVRFWVLKGYLILVAVSGGYLISVFCMNGWD